MAKKIVGYENPKGDQGKVEPVTALTKTERRRKGEVKTLQYTIAAGERAQKKLADLCINKCDHRVFKDTPGYPYYLRNCVICGANMGTV
jgi:hypothetical protein